MIYIGADHRGWELKAKICEWLSGREIDFRDMGAFEKVQDDDYVDYAILVAEEVARDPEKHRGIVICGSGMGVSIVANKVDRIRSSLGFEPDQVHAGRKDDDINVLAIAADNTGEEKAKELVEQFLETAFVMTETHRRRVDKISRIEKAIK